jgi:predicted peroxiredoxin
MIICHMIETRFTAIKFKVNPSIFLLLIFGLLLSSFTIANVIFSNDTSSFSKLAMPSIFAQDVNKTKIVYHLSSDEPWRSTIAILDSQTMLKMGFNVTLMLSIEGVQLGVKSPHHYLGLEPLTKNVSDFINDGGNVVICEVCLKIAGYNNSDIIEGSLIGSPVLMANLLNKTTVVDY